MSEKVVSLRGEFVPTFGEPNPHVVEQAEKLLELARAGQIVGMQAVTLDGNACASLHRAGSITYSLIGMLHCASIEAVQAMQASEADD